MRVATNFTFCSPGVEVLVARLRGLIRVSRPSEVAVLFSGGKDSTLLAALTLLALAEEGAPARLVTVRAETGVDPLPLLQAAQETEEELGQAGKRVGVSFEPIRVRPKEEEGFFYLLLGRGYPPPGPWFRWCTARLKEAPVQRFLRTVQDLLVLVGSRSAESQARAGSLRRNGKYPAPLRDVGNEEVWQLLEAVEEKLGVQFASLRALYRKAGDTASLRSGCWTCTLVKRDWFLERLAQDNPTLLPLLRFRQRLLALRDDPSARARIGRRRPLKARVRLELLKELETFHPLSPSLRARILARIEEDMELEKKAKDDPLSTLPLFTWGDRPGERR